MTFSEYWKDNEPFGCDAEGVARLAFNAAVAAERERCAKIAENYHGSDSKHAIALAKLIRSGE